MARVRVAEKPVERIAIAPLAVLCLVVLQIYFSTYLLISVLPVHVRALGNSEASVGSIMSLFSISALATRPFAGVLADRVGRRPSILAGGVMIGLSCIGYAVTGAQTIFLARVLNGIGWGAVTAATATVAADLAPPNRRGVVLGIYGTVTGLALAVGPSLGIWISDAIGLETSFIIAAICGFGAAVGILFLRAPMPNRPATRTRFGINDVFSRSAIGPAMIMLCFTLIYGTVLTFIPLVTIDRGLGTSGPFFAVFAIALIFLRISGGGLSDRLGRFAVIAPGFAASAAAMLVLAYAHSNTMLLLGAVLFAAAFAFIQPSSQALAVDRSPAHQRGTTLSTVVAAQDLGISSGAFLAGIIAEAFGYTDLFLTATLVSLVGLTLVLVLWRRPVVTPSTRVD